MWIAGVHAAGVAEAVDGSTNRVDEARAPRRSGRVRHAAVGAGITVSSTHRGAGGEMSPAALVDGNLATRWSSDYAEPQEILLDLGRERRLTCLKIHWEAASAERYCVFASLDGDGWRGVHLYMKEGADGEPRTDEVGLKAVPARWLRFDLLRRTMDEWGFSIHEIEIHAEDDAGVMSVQD